MGCRPRSVFDHPWRIAWSHRQYWRPAWNQHWRYRGYLHRCRRTGSHPFHLRGNENTIWRNRRSFRLPAFHPPLRTLRRDPGSNLEGDQPWLGSLFLDLSLPARLECFGFLLSGRNLRGTSPDFSLLARIREHPVIRMPIR